jgi:aliphatic nitrilase
MIDLMCDTPDKHQLIHVGGGFTVIYAPDGARIGNTLSPDQEGIVYADVDLAMIPVAKAAADPAGHYARPDVTRLLFNNRPANRVEALVLPVDQAAETARSEATAAAGKSVDAASSAPPPLAAE